MKTIVYIIYLLTCVVQGYLFGHFSVPVVPAIAIFLIVSIIHAAIQLQLDIKKY